MCPQKRNKATVLWAPGGKMSRLVNLCLQYIFGSAALYNLGPFLKATLCSGCVLTLLWKTALTILLSVCFSGWSAVSS